MALAVSFGLGVAVGPGGGRISFLALVLLSLAGPIALWLRPGSGHPGPSTVPPFHAPPSRSLLLAAAAIGVLAGGGADSTGRGAGSCRPPGVGEPSTEVEGLVLAAPAGGAFPVAVDRGLPAGCPGEVKAIHRPREGEERLRAGDRITAEAEWLSPGTPGRVPVLRLLAPRPGEVRPGRMRARARGTAARLRGRLQERLRARLGPRSGLAEALVLAERGGIPRETREAFAAAGVAHLLAISGFHVGVVAGLILAVASRMGVGRRGRRRAVAWALGAYVLFLGLPAAAVRATLLITLVGVARGLGREPHRVAVLATAFLVMLAVDPGFLGAPGFQLSFAGALGLALVVRPAASPRPPPRWLPHRVRTTAAARWIQEGILAGVAATLATLPLAVWHFGRLPLLGIPATLVLTPLAALAVPLVFLTMALDLLAPFLVALAVVPTALVLSAFELGVRWIGAIPGSWFWAPRELGILVGAALLGGTVLPRWLSVGGLRARWIARAGLLTSLLVLWPAVGVLRGAGTVEIVMLDVGQGDALPIRTPAGRWLLVDTGPARDGWDAGSARILPYLAGRGAGGLEAVVLTHPDLDHLGGLQSVLAGTDVGRVVGGGTAAGKEALMGALETARREGVPWVRARAGEVVSLDGLEISVLHPPSGPEAPREANDRSVVLLVVYGDFSALLTGDAPSAVEERLVAAGALPRGGVTLLKLGHHGSRTSTSGILLDSIRPRLALVSVGRGNRFGHPHPGVLGRLRARGIPWWSTARDGGVRIVARPDGSFEAIPVR